MISEDILACAQLVERGDPDRFAAAMAAPVEARKILFPIYAFNVEVARAPWVTKESIIAEMRLQWWRDALEEIRKRGFVRRHDVVTPLAGILDPEGAVLLDELIGARQWDIYKDPFEDAADFDRYITQTAGHLMLVSARALGEVSREDALNAGYAAGLAAFLRAVPALEAAGAVPMVDGRAEAVSELARQGLDRLASVGSIPKSVRPAFLAAWQARPLLKMARDEPERVVQDALQLSEFKKRAGLLKAALTGRV